MSAREGEAGLHYRQRVQQACTNVAVPGKYSITSVWISDEPGPGTGHVPHSSPSLTWDSIHFPIMQELKG